MNCPNDNAVMHPVRSTTHYDQLLIIDQCSHCGGIWFDEGELFRAHNDQSKKIDAFDQDALLTSSPVLDILVCPRDQTRLTQFSDPNFPQDLIVESCSQCNGMWMNRGEFSIFQNKKNERGVSPARSEADDRFQKNLRGLFDTHSTSYEGLVSVAKLLARPATTLHSIEYLLHQTKNKIDTEKSQNKLNDKAVAILKLFEEHKDRISPDKSNKHIQNIIKI